MRRFVVGYCLTLLMATQALCEEPKIEDAVKDKLGAFVHKVHSEYQAAPTEIRVLLPDKLDKSRCYPVIYVLPVEAGRESKFGDGLAEVKKRDLHIKHGAIFVAPTFAALPWYADHATDAKLRQETYFLSVVVPFVEKSYPALAKPKGRLLLGFSKSGWGAWSLLLRHPERFGRAAAWDAPLFMDRLGKFGTDEIFGTQGNFERYRIADLLKARAKELALSLPLGEGRGEGKSRLILTGYGSFREDHENTHKLLELFKIPHVYRDGPERKHDWHSGWVEEAVELLLSAEPKR
jgi:S-formylglutathione hydrolase FrmB